MKFWRQFVIFVMVLGLLLGIACQKKNARLKLPGPAPTLSVSAPDHIQEEPEPAQPEARQEATVEEPPQQKPPARHHGAKKPALPPAANQTNTAVAANTPPTTGKPPDTAIDAEVPSQQLIKQKQETASLIDSTEKDLKSLPKSGLSHDDEIIVAQIKSYVKQSHDATDAGDFERALNLASKAHLLVDALLKR
jgi:hypothetical protein